MSKKSKRARKRRNPTGRQKQFQQKLASTASASRWWWMGGIAAVLLVGAVALGALREISGRDLELFDPTAPEDERTKALGGLRELLAPGD